MSTVKTQVPLTICHYPFSVLRLGQETFSEGTVTVEVDLVAILDHEIAEVAAALDLVASGTVPVSVRITLRGKDLPQPQEVSEKSASLIASYVLSSSEPALAGVTDGFWLEGTESGSWMTCVKLAARLTSPLSNEVLKDLAKKVAKAILRATFGVDQTELKIGRGFTTQPILGAPVTIQIQLPLAV